MLRPYKLCLSGLIVCCACVSKVVQRVSGSLCCDNQINCSAMRTSSLSRNCSNACFRLGYEEVNTHLSTKLEFTD